MGGGVTRTYRVTVYANICSHFIEGNQCSEDFAEVVTLKQVSSLKWLNAKHNATLEKLRNVAQALAVGFGVCEDLIK